MPLELQGYDVLAEIARHRETFEPVRKDVIRTAHQLVAKTLKARTTDLKRVREMRGAIGEDALFTVVDGLDPSAVKSLVAKLDKYHPDQKAGDTAWQLRHFTALVRGEVEPVKKTAKAKAKAKKRAKEAAKSQKAHKTDVFPSAAGASRDRDDKD